LKWNKLYVWSIHGWCDRQIWARSCSYLYLKRVFKQVRKYNMRFNSEKCTFGILARKFLGFYLTEEN
jgi:hypothetical protein